MSQYSIHDIAMMANWSELRESKNLTLEEISKQTNIRTPKLEAIEKHEFAGLGTETFITGYIRNYAKALGEDPQVFIRVYKDSIRPLADAETRGNQPMQVKGFDWVKKMSLFHLSIAVIILWLLAMFLFSSGDKDEPSAGAEPPTATIEDMQDSASPTIDVSTAAPQFEPEVPTEVLEEIATETQNNDDSVQIESRVSEPNEDILIFTFSDDCWLEVKDASGRVLIAELQKKGDNRRVFGRAPFEIMLGNARAVIFTINGEVVSTKPPSGRKTMRFTVPQERL